MPPEPTVQGGHVRSHRAEARDPFLAVADNTAAIRRAVAIALNAIVPAGAFLKLSNITIDAGKVNEQNIVVEIRTGK
jgi:hypothetical protein